jgi:hypothetical protein
MVCATPAQIDASGHFAPAPAQPATEWQVVRENGVLTGPATILIVSRYDMYPAEAPLLPICPRTQSTHTKCPSAPQSARFTSAISICSLLDGNANIHGIPCLRGVICESFVEDCLFLHLFMDLFDDTNYPTQQQRERERERESCDTKIVMPPAHSVVVQLPLLNHGHRERGRQMNTRAVGYE